MHVMLNHILKNQSLVLSLSFALSIQSIRRVASTGANPKRMKAAQFEVGGPELLTIGQVARPTAKSGEAIIKVVSSAINRADTIQRRGLYPPPPGESDILGLEAAGFIHEINSSDSQWKVGDKVMALLPGGGNAEFATVNVHHLMPIPKSVSMLEAGGIPEVWLTAFQLLHLVGTLKTEDKVLIHAGASGVGTAAIQLVRLHGALPYVTAGSDEKIAFAKSLGAEEGFNYKKGEWSAAVKEATGGSGVNLILDCVGGSHWKQNAEAIALDGRWVLYGLMGGPDVEGKILPTVLRKRVQLLGSTLRTRSVEYKANLITKFIQQALPHFDEMKLKPIVETAFDLDMISDAHSLMESNRTTGKILLRVSTQTSDEKDEL